MKLLRFFAAVVCCSLAFQAFALPQNDAAQPKRVRIELKDAVRMRTHSVEAEYPTNALADHLGGPAFLSIVINRQGKVIEAAPVSFDEWPPNRALSEDPRLREAAVKAVKQWEYRPYLLNGQPVEVETQVAVNFKTRYSTEDSSSGGVIGGGGVIGVPGGVGSVPGGFSGGGVIGGIIGSGAPPPKVAVPRRQKVSSEAMEANLLKHEDPVYPPLARVAKIQGEVRLQARISKTGAVENLRGISGHPILIQPAMDAVRQWKYKPFLLDGEPIEAEGEIIVVFKM
jgi:TonB family protein